MRLRRIGVKRFVGYGLLAILLVGCGSDGGGDAQDLSAGESSPTSTCVASLRPGPGLGVEADLDGDGTAERVQVTPPSTGCPLVVSADVDGPVAVSVAEDLPDVAAIGAVAIAERDGQIVLVKLSHPRGGFQVRLFGYDGGELAELTDGGEPVLPFVATDAPTHYLAARCTSDGLEVTEALAHEPIGVVPAWDIYRTSYIVDGNTLTAGDRTEVADNVLDEQLENKYTDLMHYRLFENCKA